MENAINEVIIKINSYLSTINSDDKHDYSDFISKNKSIFSVNLGSTFTLTSDDIKLIFNLVKKNINKDLIVDYVINSFKVKLDKQVSIGSNVKKFVDYSEMNFFNLLLKYGTITVYPKKTVFLWNTVKENIVELSRLFIPDENESVAVKYISFDEMYKVFDKNKEYFLNNNILLNFGNMSRIVGTSLSEKFLKLHYIIHLDFGGFNLKVFVYDNVSFNEFSVEIDKKTIHYKDLNIERIINDFINIIIKKVKSDDDSISYYRIFLVYKRLTYYLMYIFKEYTESENNKQIPPSYILVDIDSDTFQKDLECEHVVALANAIVPSPDYFSKINNFVKNYIDSINNISVCKICGEYIQMFDQDERSYIQKDGDIIITSIRDSIFDYEPYKNFLDANVYFFDTLNVFDGMFKTNTVNYINNIAKLSIDYFLYLGEKRLELEKIQSLKNIIDNYGLFFLRLSNKFFTFVDDKVDFLKRKKLNMSVIVLLSVLIFSGFDIVKQIISVKQFRDIFEMKRLRDDSVYNFFLSKVITMYIIRNKLIDKKYKDNIPILVDAYTNLLLNDELGFLYDYNKTTFDNNIKNIEGEDTIYVLRLKKRPEDEKYNLEYFEWKNVFYRKNIYDKYNKMSHKDKSNKFLDILLHLDSYESFIQNKEKTKFIEQIVEKSTFPKLFWEDEEIKLRPKELRDNMFVVNLKNSNKFIDINNSLNTSKINIKADHRYSFFNFGDPYPFIMNLSRKHVSKILDSLIRLIIYFFPNTNVPTDLCKFLDIKSDNIERLYIYYIYFSTFSFLTNNNLNSWIDENENEIIKLYNQEHNKFYEI